MRERRLHSSSFFAVHEFECDPDDDAWRSVNVIESDAPLVVFPRVRAVGIRQDGMPPVLATPNHVMFYNPGQSYERRLVDERGDRCVYVTLLPDACAELERESLVLRGERLTASHAPVSPGAYLRQHALVRRLRERAVEELLVDEATASVVAEVLLPRMRVEARTRSTETAHRRLAEATKELLATSVAQTHTLPALARALDVSPFHLARVFREQTGFTVHRYLTQLRLRLALDGLQANGGSLAALALELGFASHSHFTDTFRREFGAAPSAILAA